MKTDKELLELAAKAAGYAVYKYIESYDDYYWHGPINGLQIQGSEVPVWNPLTDDGDALRLAVRLNLLVDFQSRAAMPCDKPGKDADWCGGEHNEDAAADCRRAIVRAAAAIGATK